MSFVADTLSRPRPSSLDELRLPRRQQNHPSPVDWRDEVLYFLLVDRFSDGREADRPAARPRQPRRRPGRVRRRIAWRWDRWVASGRNRWQGGTLRGVRVEARLPPGPRRHHALAQPCVSSSAATSTRYHGYGVQDFLDVDPRFGTASDLVELVAEDAHGRGMRVILDIIFNHSGSNWLYPAGTPGGPHKASVHRRPPSVRRLARRATARRASGDRRAGTTACGRPSCRTPDAYTRAGSGSLGAGDVGDPDAEHKRTDFEDLRDLALDRAGRAERPRALLQVLDRADRL